MTDRVLALEETVQIGALPEYFAEILGGQRNVAGESIHFTRGAGPSSVDSASGMTQLLEPFKAIALKT